MKQKPDVSPDTSANALKKKPAPGLLMLSSEEVGWQDLKVRLYQEPLEEREGWIEPTISDTALIIFTRGASSVETARQNRYTFCQRLQQW
jgi:hypothetical protein